MKTLFNTIRSSARLLKIGFAANVLEWYEFVIYHYLIIVMGQNFLATTHPIMMTVKAYVIFTVSHLARPLGSVFYGYLGSEVGRGYALKRSLVTMAIPTALIGLLPTYSQAGIISMVALLLLRFIQGFAAGGELPMSACYVYESAPSHLRSFLCSTVATGSSIGLLLSSATVSLLFWCFDQSTILDWAWRIPYLLSIPLSLYIFYLRSAIHEPVATKQSASLRQIGQRLAQLLNGVKAKVLPLMLLVGFMETCVYMLIFWMPTYLHHFLSVPLPLAQSINTLMLVVYILFSLLSGYIAGYIGPQRLLTIHIAGIFTLTYPLFYMLQGASYTTLLSVHIAFAWLLSGVVSVMMETLGTHFDQTVRAFGMSVTHTLAATLFGGTTPLLCTYLTYQTEMLMFAAIYVVVFAGVALGLVSYLFKKDMVSHPVG